MIKNTVIIAKYSFSDFAINVFIYFTMTHTNFRIRFNWIEIQMIKKMFKLKHTQGREFKKKTENNKI